MTTQEMPVNSMLAPAPGARRRAGSRALIVPAVAVAVGAIALVWAGNSGFRQDLLVMVAVYALIALGMYIPFVMAGSMSMAYAAYAAIGAYSVAIVTTETGLPPILGWIIGPLISAAVAVVLGLLTRRLNGFYLAAVTLLFSMAFEPWVIALEPITGGSAGIGGIPSPTFFGWEPPRLLLLAIALLLVVVVATLIERIRTGAWGVTVRTMRDVPSAVEAMGTRTTTLTTVTLAVGAAVASLAGALFVSFMLSITPETFTLSIVFMALFVPLIGGQATAWGCVIGAIVVIQLTSNMPSAFEGSGQLVLAIGVLLILLIAPAGLIGYGKALVGWVRGRIGKARG
ncbi:branched-chain amino acid ABC transporter permease [Microbacterium sp. NPDC028030]|uniref:branched-chain amino acid ABC transporter permease n=1 Tax=Microbacterium sp. NPDC028030 TaxID=3155124 RepID=UPI0034049B31